MPFAQAAVAFRPDANEPQDDTWIKAMNKLAAHYDAMNERLMKCQ